MNLAIKAHLEKKEFISKLMSRPELPLWEVGRVVEDGRPYVELSKATYIIGLIGLNEALAFLLGRELHEDDDMLREGLKVVSFIYFKAKEAEKAHGMKFSLEESPAESASRRLAKVDVKRYPEAMEVVRGNPADDSIYYTNSIHLRADAPVDMLTRIIKQAKFHTMIESGAMIHAFVGEERPPAESVENLVRKTFEKTRAAQLCISPEFTICNDCQKMTRGLQDHCQVCDSKSVYGITRIVGYFSRVNNWNRSKLGELVDRHKGNYRVDGKPVAVPSEARGAAGSA
jgi:ribonucleoside-triphosphate reductase (formate)